MGVLLYQGAYERSKGNFIFPTTEGFFLKYSSAAAYEVGCVRDVASRKLSYFLEFWNETWREWSLDIDAGTAYVPQQFAHRRCMRAKPFTANGRKMRVFNVYSLNQGD